MGTGKLIVQVRNARGIMPLDDVRVIITDEQGDEILYDLFTDISGDTKAVSLETVDRELSLDPDYQGSPYEVYNVELYAAGFNSLRIVGVPIFEGEIAIQPVTLIPMLRSQDTPVQYDIFIDKPAVESSKPRNQEGPIIDPIILRHVIIPNPITVHLGTPTSSAANVQVTFPDYVKNVASSEIYPTWPQASLEANIYAIITFALNRVFTEWYRTRGYNFDITNSTAYDQAFQYGRTIFDSVSRIVDEIFNQYVRRQGQISPYFTSFCNGTTSTCSGLSQWGTVDLANKGMTPLQILRYYYPDDIKISETNIITGIVTSYPGTALKIGNRSRDVEVIQRYLDRIRNNYPAIPLITDGPGVFGESTQAAVKKFQSVFNLSADGIVGVATWNKISSIYTAVAKLSELNSEGTEIGIGTVPPNTILHYEATGNDVLTLQYVLSMISEFYPTIPMPSLTGQFDLPTLESIVTFQRMMGLAADGIVGPATWDILYETYWGIMDGENIPEPDAIEYIVRAGDTLWLLAQRFNTTIAAIMSLSNLTSDALYIGQRLLIPNTATPNTTYTVRAGDTLWLLAQRFGTTVDMIVAINNLTSDILDIGQVLVIPQSRSGC